MTLFLSNSERKDPRCMGEGGEPTHPSSCSVKLPALGLILDPSGKLRWGEARGFAPGCLPVSYLILEVTLLTLNR